MSQSRRSWPDRRSTYLTMAALPNSNTQAGQRKLLSQKAGCLLAQETNCNITSITDSGQAQKARCFTKPIFPASASLRNRRTAATGTVQKNGGQENSSLSADTSTHWNRLWHLTSPLLSLRRHRCPACETRLGPQCRQRGVFARDLSTIRTSCAAQDLACLAKSPFPDRCRKRARLGGWDTAADSNRSVRFHFFLELQHTTARFALGRFELSLAPHAGFLIMLAATQLGGNARFLALFLESFEDAIYRLIFLKNHNPHRPFTPFYCRKSGHRTLLGKQPRTKLPDPGDIHRPGRRIRPFSA